MEYILVSNILYKKNNDEYVLFVSCNPYKYKLQIYGNDRMNWVIKCCNNIYIKLNCKFVLFDKIKYHDDIEFNEKYIFCDHNKYCLICKKDCDETVAYLYNTDNPKIFNNWFAPSYIQSISKSTKSFLLWTKKSIYRVEYHKYYPKCNIVNKCIKCIDNDQKCSELQCPSSNIPINCKQIKLHTTHSQKICYHITIHVNAYDHSIINNISLDENEICYLFGEQIKTHVRFGDLTYSGNLYVNHNKIMTNVKSVYYRWGTLIQLFNNKLFIFDGGDIKEIKFSNDIVEYVCGDDKLFLYTSNNLMCHFKNTDLWLYLMNNNNLLSTNDIKLRYPVYDCTDIVNKYGKIIKIIECNEYVIFNPILFTANGYILNLQSHIYNKYDPNEFVDAFYNNIRYHDKDKCKCGDANDKMNFLTIVNKNKISIINMNNKIIHDFDFNEQLIKCNDEYIYPKINAYNPINIYHICDNYKYLHKTTQKQIFTFLCVLKEYLVIPKPLIYIVLGLLLN